MRYQVALLAALAVLSSGCQSDPRLARLNPFFRPDRTSFATPAERAANVREIADKSTGQDTPEQRELVEQLVETLASENDPLIRQAALESAAAFRTPLSEKALIAALKDNDPHVRRTGCRLLGDRGAADAVDALAAVAQSDDSFDVRVAAARSLGRVGAPKERLLPLLQDPNPAMQLAGVEAMRRTTGRDLGGDVSAYVALAQGAEPPADAEDRTSVANRLPDWIPFF
ncbi:HEAT repeat domain-containing protein [Botrimarina sp.]|uniref:HEAT repeat domain-containing protein n=1 Tax=Botrimarina sp. TaxID=2795802 RepID=UPI0032F07814